MQSDNNLIVQCHGLQMLITRVKSESFLGPTKFFGPDEIEKMAAGNCLLYYLLIIISEKNYSDDINFLCSLRGLHKSIKPNDFSSSS